MAPATSRSDPEQARLALARARIPAVCARYAHDAQILGDRLRTAPNAAARERAVARTALALWQTSVNDAQREGADDRALYWGRLALREAITDNTSGHLRDGLLAIAERHSRGLAGLRFPATAGYRILVTGFDPFRLNDNIDQSNPAGLAALNLHGATLKWGNRRAHVQAALIPVRFADFDAGLIEEFFTRQYRDSIPSMVVTMSMGRDGFDLERFPGMRRSAELPDNRNDLSGATARDPLIPMLDGRPLHGPEFVEFSLPAEAMLKAGGDWTIRDNRCVQTLERGPISPACLTELEGTTAVCGSGGGYLSNEISYRTVLLRNKLNCTFPIGHIHTPSVAGCQPETEHQIVVQIRRMLEYAIRAA